MKNLIIAICLLCFVSATKAQSIIAAEYFIDTDPGLGSATPITVSPAGATVNFNANIPTASLSNGFHFVAIRTKDANGNWGLYENRGFYISNSTANASNIVAAEFFVDVDPGVGNGTAITPVISGANVSFVANVTTTSLSQGFHFVSIRTKNADGNWGLFENRGFYISNAASNASNIVAAEFFVDADPGVGNASAITPVVSGANASFVANVPTTSLSNGFHFVAIRTKNSDGNWGLFESRGFYISTQTANAGNMIKAEYFIDTDPGVGNGIPITIPSTTSINQNFVLNIPSGTSSGQHFIAIRMMDEWGLFEFDTITVTGVLPLQLLDFDAFKINKIVQLKWTTENEINTSHVEIERSTNGSSFTSIGTIQSIHAVGTNNYSFKDNNPINGINYYRLKQVDIDGSFTYSNIKKVMFETFGNDVNIFPNPAKVYIQFDYSGMQKTVLVNIFDVQGRLVKTTTLANIQPIKLNVENLAKGKYIVQLSDGVSIAVGNFIKQ